jgi:hypothetical protein
MMRTVWLATICLAVLSALALGKALRTPADLVAEAPIDQMTVGTGLAQDMLSKADRLKINYPRKEILLQPAVQPTEPIVPAVSTIPRAVEPKIISRHWHDSHALPSSAAKPKHEEQTGSNKKSKAVDGKPKQRIVLNQQNR